MTKIPTPTPKTTPLQLKRLVWNSPMEHAQYALVYGLRFEIVSLQRYGGSYRLYPPGASSTYDFDAIGEAKAKADDLYRDIIADLFVDETFEGLPTKIILA